MQYWEAIINVINVWMCHGSTQAARIDIFFIFTWMWASGRMMVQVIVRLLLHAINHRPVAWPTLTTVLNVGMIGNRHTNKSLVTYRRVWDRSTVRKIVPL